MLQDDNFFSDNKGSIFRNTVTQRPKESVIKSSDIVLGPPAKIKPKVAAHTHTHNRNVFPLMEGEEIVGFVYECSCGEVAKIMFDFQQKTERAAV